MSKDIILGESTRNWARDADLLADPVTTPAPASPAAEALRSAMDFDRSMKIRPAAGRGVMATKVWKF
jgi:hypothetical protein